MDYDITGYPNGKEWYLNDKLHKKDGPAVEHSDGHKEWWLNGKRHRENGPAIEFSDEHKEWWFDGKEYTEEEYKKLTYRWIKFKENETKTIHTKKQKVSGFILTRYEIKDEKEEAYYNVHCFDIDNNYTSCRTCGIREGKAYCPIKKKFVSPDLSCCDKYMTVENYKKKREEEIYREEERKKRWKEKKKSSSPKLGMGAERVKKEEVILINAERKIEEKKIQ